TCPRATPPVLARHHLSSRDTTCPRATPPVLARHHLSSRDTTCPRATPPVLARHHLSSRDTTCPRATPHSIDDLIAMITPTWIMHGGPLFATFGRIKRQWTVEDVIATIGKVAVRATNTVEQDSFLRNVVTFDHYGKRRERLEPSSRAPCPRYAASP